MLGHSYIISLLEVNKFSIDFKPNSMEENICRKPAYYAKTMTPYYPFSSLM